MKTGLVLRPDSKSVVLNSTPGLLQFFDTNTGAVSEVSVPWRIRHIETVFAGMFASRICRFVWYHGSNTVAIASNSNGASNFWFSFSYVVSWCFVTQSLYLNIVELTANSEVFEISDYRVIHLLGLKILVSDPPPSHTQNRNPVWRCFFCCYCNSIYYIIVEQLIGYSI